MKDINIYLISKITKFSTFLLHHYVTFSHRINEKQVFFVLIMQSVTVRFFNKDIFSLILWQGGIGACIDVENFWILQNGWILQSTLVLRYLHFWKASLLLWTVSKLKLFTVSQECGSGFTEVPASDSTSKWARNPN